MGNFDYNITQLKVYNSAFCSKISSAKSIYSFLHRQNFLDALLEKKLFLIKKLSEKTPSEAPRHQNHIGLRMKNNLKKTGKQRVNILFGRNFYTNARKLPIIPVMTQPIPSLI